MKREQIIEGNKLIADFMGLEVIQVYSHITRQYFPAYQNEQIKKYSLWVPCDQCERLLYHTSWDWLMPVVEKIEQGHRVNIYGKGCKINRSEWTFDIAKVNESKITAVWLAVVECIELLNSEQAPERCDATEADKRGTAD